MSDTALRDPRSGGRLARLAELLLVAASLALAAPGAGGGTLPPVTIDGCDTGLADAVVADGLTISALVGECAAAASDHCQLVTCVAWLADDLKKAGIIGGRDQGSLVSCAARAGDEVLGLDPLVPRPLRFVFESARDELSVALRDVHAAYVTAPATPEGLAAIYGRRNAAVLYLRARPEEAAQRLVEEAECLGPTDVTRLQSVFHLLGWFDSETGVAFLHQRSTSELPPPAADDEGVSLLEIAETVRRHAVMGLGRLRHQGSEGARLRLLDLVGADDPQLTRLAIKTYYDGAGQRWRAKQEMAPRLPVQSRHLLHEIY